MVVGIGHDRADDFGSEALVAGRFGSVPHEEPQGIVAVCVHAHRAGLVNSAGQGTTRPQAEH